MIESGERLTDCCARYNFGIVSQALGLREPQSFCKHGRGPRIHDLRHTFAVRTIIGWYRKGLDPDREMIKLSTYLGHSKPENTYWYIEAVPELLQLASAPAERTLASVRRDAATARRRAAMQFHARRLMPIGWQIRIRAVAWTRCNAGSPARKPDRTAMPCRPGRRAWCWSH